MTKACLWRVVLPLGVVASLAWHTALVEAAGWAPVERLDRPWQVQSFVGDGGLANLTVFDVAFEQPGPVGKVGTAWVATSRGLHEFNGYTWQHHGRQKGLPSDFVRCVTVTRSGRLWVGTDRGAGIYDGKTFASQGSETGLAGLNVRRITEDAEGGVWFCSDTWPTGQGRGGLTRWRDGQWRRYGAEDGLTDDYLVNYFRNREGTTLVAALGGIFRMQGDRWVPFSPESGGEPDRWSSGGFAEMPGLGTFLSNGRRVFLLRGDQWIPQPAGLPHEHGVTSTSDGSMVAVEHVAPGRGAFVEWKEGGWNRLSDSFVLPGGSTVDLRECPDGSVWALGYNCLTRWSRRSGQWRQFDQLPPPLFSESGGRIWFARLRGRTTPPGVPVRLTGESWEQLDTAYDGLVLAPDGQTVWGWTTNSVVRWSGSVQENFPSSATGLTAIHAGQVDGSGRAWILGTDAEAMPAVSCRENGTWTPRRVPGWRDMRLWKTTATSGNSVWFAADRGPRTEGEVVCWTRDGFERTPIPGALIGFREGDLFADRSGALWLHGETRLARLPAGGKQPWEPVPGPAAEMVLGCAERGDGLWFLCHGALSGVHALARYVSPGTWTTLEIETLGDLFLAPDQSLLWGGDGRFHEFGPGPEDRPFAIDLPKRESVQRVIKDPQGTFWLLAGGSVYRFRSDRTPPETRIKGPSSVMDHDVLHLTAQAIDRFRPLGYRRDHQFQWRLDEGPWSKPSRNHEFIRPVEGLRPGMHRIEVRSIDLGKDEDPTPATLAFRVLPIPLQNRRWFPGAVAAILGTFGGLAAFAFHARRKLVLHARSLERHVAERTAALTADIERRIAAEQSARESEERFSKAFRSSPVIAAISLFPEGILLEVNEAFTETLGYTPSEVLGRRSVELGIWMRPEQRTTLLEALARGENVRHAECDLRTKSGRALKVLTSIEPIELSGKRALLFVSLDITDRVKLESQLRHAMKLEAIGLLSGGIAHDFNNILGVILGNAQMAVLDLPPDHPAAASLSQISQSASRAASLVRQILAFARQEPNERHPVDLRPVVQECFRMLRSTLPSGVEITALLPSVPCRSLADESQIHQVILNLGTNAWHAMEGRAGRIEIGLTHVLLDRARANSHPNLRPGPYNVLRVTDTGKGMAPEVLERIFDPFFTTKQSGQGTGLGLSVVHGIVQNHDGAILVRSTPGQGTTFELFLPALDAAEDALPTEAPGPAPEAQATLPAPPTPAPPPPSQPLILVVDDEEPIVRTVGRALERFGYRVKTFCAAAEALEVFRQDPGSFALVITDLNMPRMSGIDLARELLQVRPGLTVLLTSGFIGEEIRRDIEFLGIHRVLRKPCSLAELKTAVAQALQPGSPPPADSAGI